jgi:hypothetical protein
MVWFFEERMQLMSEEIQTSDSEEGNKQLHSQAWSLISPLLGANNLRALTLAGCLLSLIPGSCQF